MSYTELVNMPIDELSKIIECANKIQKQRDKEMKKNA